MRSPWRSASAALLALLVLLSLLMSLPARADIVLVGTSTATNENIPTDGSPGAVSFPRPNGVGAGDALVVSIAVRPRSMNVVAPAGWVQMTFTDQPDGGTATAPAGSTLVTFYKVATTTEPASYTWTFANSHNAGGMVAGVMMAYTGIDTSTGNPIDDNGNAWAAFINSASLTHRSGTITTVTPGTLILASLSFNSASNFDAPSGIAGIAEVVDLWSPPRFESIGITLQFSAVANVPVGTHGPVQATATDYSGAADYGIGHIMALKPTQIDPALTLVRSAALSPGGNASYQLTVRNRGVMPEPGPLTVVTTLPPGLTYSSASGSGWTCSPSGQTITCSRSGALAANTNAPVLTVNASVSAGASGAYTTQATVSGTGGDGNVQNNTAVDTYVIPSARYASYALDEAAWGQVKDSSGNSRHGTALGTASPTGNPPPAPYGAALSGSPGTCGAALIPDSTGAQGVATGIDMNNIGATGSIAFWYAAAQPWANGTARLLFDASNDLSTGDRHFFLAKTGSGALVFSLQDSAGTTATLSTASYGFAANTWHHIAVSWHLASGTLKIYVDGTLAASNSTALNGALGDASQIYIGSRRTSGITGTPAAYNSNSAHGLIDEWNLYTIELGALEVADLTTRRHACTSGIDHYELEVPTTGVSCLSHTVRVVACADASSPCTNKATTLAGQTALLSATAGNLANTTVTFDATGVASTSYSPGAAADGSTVSISLSNEQALASEPRKCCPNGASCAAGDSCGFVVAHAGFKFDVPDHLAETNTRLNLQAVRKSNNSLACTPAFANTTKVVRLRCSYTNPGTGTLPVRIGGTALNAAGDANAACDANGRDLSLSFDASGVAATTALYADAGLLTLTATHTGSGADAGLTMTGTDTFRVAPFDFAVSGISASLVGAGNNTSATVTARNYVGATTPNFGRESTPESVSLGFVRAAPTGAGAVSGSFSGSVGSFSGGVATASNISYSEVGRIDIVATLASSGYQGSAYRPAGSSHGAMVWCANENGTCTLPAGTVNTVWYAAYTHGTAYVLTGRSGSVPCNNTTFGDPWVGSGKGCWYVSTSGVHSSNTGALGLRPHRFDLSATAACVTGAFTYAGQPYSLTVTARNAAGATTVNYDGTALTSPPQAQAVTLSDANSLGLGTLSGHSVAASAFAAGVATASPTYTFTSKQTVPQSLVLRATDGQGTSSAGGTEPPMALRSGRLRLSNAFGRANTALQVPVVAEHWQNGVWQVNAADSCTTLPTTAVVLSNPRDALGQASGASTSVVGGSLSFSAGRATLQLAAPSPAGQTVSFDLALNLGSTPADNSCHGLHPASTGGLRAWLRSRHGGCSSAWDRDPGARATFGIYSPEARRSVHIRDLF